MKQVRESDHTTLSEETGKFLEDLRTRGDLSENTLAAYRSDLQRLESYAAAHSIHTAAELDASALQHYITSLTGDGHRQSSIRRTISCLHGFFRYLRKKGEIPKDYSEVLDTVASPRAAAAGHREEALSEEEVSRLMASVNLELPVGQRDAAILHLLTFSGLQAGEVRLLRIRDLDLLLNEALVTSESGSCRRVPVDPQCAGYLRNYIAAEQKWYEGREDYVFHHRSDGKPITRQNIWKLVRKYSTRSGLEPPVTPRRLRLTARRILTEKGVGAEQVRSILGTQSK